MSDLEQRVGAAFREGDRVPVDAESGRGDLLDAMSRVRAETKRGRLVGALAAAALLVLLLSATAVFEQRRSEHPVPPASTLANGLPIGRLTANVEVTDGHAPKTFVFSLQVDRDGTGRFTAPRMALRDAYAVRFVGIAPGVVRVVHLDSGTCSGRTEVTLHFVPVKGGVRITAVDPAGCFTEPDIAQELAGTVLTWYPVPGRTP